MSDFEKLGASEARAFEDASNLFDLQTRQIRAAERSTTELIEIKFLLKALVEQSRVKDAGAVKKE